MAQIIEFTGKGSRNACVLSGVHGDEPTSIIAVHMFMKYNLKSLPFKKITVVPVVNTTGFRHQTRNHSVDLNRDPQGNPADLIKMLINDNDVIIDVHTSPHCAVLSLIDDNKYTDALVRWSKKAGIAYCIRKGVTGTIKQRAVSLGKVGATLECSGMDMLNIGHAHQTAKAIYKMLETAPEALEKGTAKQHKGIKAVNMNKAGIFVPAVELGTRVKKGVIIAYINSYDGKSTPVKANVDGRVVVFGPGAIAYKGDGKIWIQPE